MKTQLDDVRAQFDAGHPTTATHNFIRAAEQYRWRTKDDAEAWTGFVERTADILTQLRHDPITARSAERPRGYPGDAVLLDLIYEEQPANLQVDRSFEDVGAAVNSVILAAPAPTAARWRRDHIAAVIDKASSKRDGLEVLSIASGHCRELERSLAVASGRLARFVALDQDEASLDVARRDNGPMVETAAHRISDVISGCLDGDGYDLVYSLGLFDYLPDAAASNLLEQIAKVLNPGGEAIVANFAGGDLGQGYMESAMDWWLIYRNESALLRLAARLPDDCAVRTYPDPAGTLAFLSIARPPP